MSIPLGILGATFDPELQRHPRTLHVLVCLHMLLDEHEYGMAKQVWIGRKLGISQPATCRSLNRLRTRGFIEAGPRIGAANTYRLALPVAQPEAKAA